MKTLLIPALLLLLILPAQAQEERKPPKFENLDVKGLVVDTDGKPVAGATIAEFWNYDGAWSTEAGVQTDAEGRFTITVRTFPEQPDRGYKLQAGLEKRGAIAVLKTAELKAEVKLTLHPLTAVTAALETEEGFEIPDGGYVNVYWKAPFSWLCSTQVKDKAFALSLPPGDYSTMIMLGNDFKFARPSFKVEGGEKQALTPIKLEVAPIARFYGKPAPAINVSYVRNLPEDLEGKGAEITLVDFKGRWVLIEFWGFW